MAALKQELILMVSRTIFGLIKPIKSMSRSDIVLDLLSVIGVFSGVTFLLNGYESGNVAITILASTTLAICLTMINIRKM